MSNKEVLENLKKIRIGVVNYNNKNELMKVIDYCSSNKVLIEFQDEWKATKYVSWCDFQRGAVRNPSYKNTYVGITNKNKDGYIMKIIQYNSPNDIIVEFQDECHETVKSAMKEFRNGSIRNPKIDKNRLNSTTKNKQGYIINVIEYIDSHNIIVEFQDVYKCKVKSRWDHFIDGSIENPYCPTVYGVGIVGNKYLICKNDVPCKEYNTWRNMLNRCYNEDFKETNPTYKDAKCCNEWLLYENFYEWLHNQENFTQWYNIEFSALDKDILIKKNKLYSPKTCCLVPQYINNLFIKSDAARGIYPIGVCEQIHKYIGKNGIYIYNGKYAASVSSKYIGTYDTPDKAFRIYKTEKEKLIKQVAQDEFVKGNITQLCYDAMMNYVVEIND